MDSKQNRGPGQMSRFRLATVAFLVGIVCFAALLLTSPGLPMVWDEGDAIRRAEGIARWFGEERRGIAADWQYTTRREGHPAFYGIVIAADLEASYEVETIGALAASIQANIQKSLDRLDTSDLKQVTIEAESGKLFFVDAGLGILVVTTEMEVNIGLIRLEIKNALGKLKMAG